MAIRMAVGARPSSVLSLVIREALNLAAIGSALGCIAAAMAGRAATSLLFGTMPTNPVILGTASALMLLVSVVATFAPARLAARSDPSVLLRAE